MSFLKLERDSLVVIISDSSFHPWKPQMRTVWTVIALCVGMIMPDNVPWRNTVAEKEQKPVCLNSSRWIQTQESVRG